MADSGKETRKTGIPSCPVCAVRGKGTTEVYLLGEGEDALVLNVDRAKVIVSDGRPAQILDQAELAKIVTANDYSLEHLEHVVPAWPGITMRGREGLILVDGIHRAVHCLNVAKPFHAYLLSYSESMSCTVEKGSILADAACIVGSLRRLFSDTSVFGTVQVELECDSRVMGMVLSLLTPEERPRVVWKETPAEKNRE